MGWLGKVRGDRGGGRARSLPEVHGSVAVPYGRSLFRRIFAVAGPAYLVSVGYMDPGNWATDLAAGSRYNYALLWVLLMSNLMAVLLQSFSARLGVVRGLDLAQACREEYPKGVNAALYVLCEVAITACDLAEVLGSAIALQLLFGLPLLWGVILTAADTFALLFLSHWGIRRLEALIISMITVIAGAFFVEIFLARPEWGGVAAGFLPRLPDATALFVAMGMLGATVMPHNLYLHSSLVQTRRTGESLAEKRQAIRFNTFDSVVALNMAFFVNAAILVMAAAVFFRSGHFEVAEIQDAHALLEPLLGAAAPLVFATALLASGQSSTITGTLAGQIVMEGFLNIRIPPWVRRLITRLLAILPAVVVILVYGDPGTGDLLVLSQVVLSLQLPFAIVPLLHFVADREKMGELAAGRVLKALGWASAAVVVALNAKLVWDQLRIWLSSARGGGVFWIYAAAVPVSAGLAGLLLYVVAKPWLPRIVAMTRRPRKAPIHAPAGSIGPVLEGAGEGRAYSKVAVALDFSGRDAEVLQETLRFLGDRRPELGLMHVVESATAKFLGEESADAESQADEERLQEYAAALRNLGFTVTPMLGQGRRVPELARMIGDFGADLVVLGAHGHRLLSDLFLGSTADSLRHRIKAHVLVVARGPG
jgi:manganese transport protein